MIVKENIGTIVIHQPHFMAWLPYYCKFASSDICVIMDDVNFRRHFYHNRTFFLDKQLNPILCNMPTNGSQNMVLNEVMLINTKYHFEKILNKILYTYKRRPYFDDFYYFLNKYKSDFIQQTTLVGFNTLFLNFVFDILEITPPIIDFSSKLAPSNDRNKRIIEICKKKNKSLVMCGWGASKDIHNMSSLQENNISLISITKEQFLSILGDYELVDGVSIVDILVKKGIDYTREIFNRCLTIYTNKINEKYTYN